MQKWIAIAKATMPEIPAEELGRLAAPLAALEEQFRPLLQQLTPDIEPAVAFHMEQDPQ
jgi:hypothetical protein